MAWEDMLLSVDLTSETLNQLDFLLEVDRCPGLYGGHVLARAVDRYQRSWLPLAAKHDSETLAAPLDIEWAWNCHMLAPLAYQKDCLDLVGTIVPHRVMNPAERLALLEKSEQLWESEYPGQAFIVDLVDSPQTDIAAAANVISCDLAAIASVQKSFVYQVSLPHYRDPKFLDKCLERYKKFLYLQQTKPMTFMVSCSDIDLMWHSHQLNPGAYKTDTEKILGKTFGHVMSMHDNCEPLSLDEIVTRRLWKATFSESFTSPGAMYRGEPSAGTLYEMSDAEISSMAIRGAQINLTSMQLDRFPKDVRWLKLEIFFKKIVRDFEIVTYTSKEWENKKTMEWKEPHLFSEFIDLDVWRFLKFRLIAIAGHSIFKKEFILGEGKFDFLPLIRSLGEDSIEVSGKVVIKPTTIALTFKGVLGQPKKGRVKLTVKNGLFSKKRDRATHRDEIWGPVSLPRPVRPQETYEEGMHSLVFPYGQTAFVCKVIHSTDLMTSALYVYYEDKLVSCAHSIGPDQLPDGASVLRRKKAVVMNPESGDRAMLIKNNNGDWGVAIGKWVGFSLGAPALNGPKKHGSGGIPGSLGYLYLRFLKFTARSWEEVSLSQYQRGVFAYKAADFSCGEADITIEKNFKEIPENIALALSVSLLHVLCMSRHKNWVPGTKLTSYPLPRSVRKLPCDEVPLLIAAGLHCRSPCNHYIQTSYKEDASARAQGAHAAWNREGGKGRGVVEGEKAEDDLKEEFRGQPEEPAADAEADEDGSEIEMDCVGGLVRSSDSVYDIPDAVSNS